MATGVIVGHQAAKKHENLDGDRRPHSTAANRRSSHTPHGDGTAR